MKTILSLIFTILISLNLHAITIDDFLGTPQSEFTTVIDSTLNPYVNSSTVTHTGAVGGTRSIINTSSNVSPQLSVSRFSVSNGSVFRTEGGGFSGVGCMVWDADGLDGLTDYTGLNGLDLQADNATAFNIRVVQFDYANSFNTRLKFRVFDASDATGGTWSSANLDLAENISYIPYSGTGKLFTVPFASFTTSGPNGATNFSNLGAIEVCIDTETFGGTNTDFIFDLLNTNGDCSHVPIGGVVKDECGVCGGDNTSCMDCEEDPNGTKLPGTSCDSDQVGQCSDAVYNDNCECTHTEPSLEICDLIDNDCDGQTDEENICQETCPEGEVIDRNGNCVESPCSHGEIIDENGNCIDSPCNEGEVIDQNGNCICEDLETSYLNKQLDGGADIQRRIIGNMSKLLRRYDNSSQMNSYINNKISKADELESQNWVFSWTIPSLSSACVKSQAQCIEHSNVEVVEAYAANNLALYKLTKKMFKKACRLGNSRAKRRALRLRNKAQSVMEQNEDTLDLIPKVQIVCLDN